MHGILQTILNVVQADTICCCVLFATNDSYAVPFLGHICFHPSVLQLDVQCLELLYPIFVITKEILIEKNQKHFSEQRHNSTHLICLLVIRSEFEEMKESNAL